MSARWQRRQSRPEPSSEPIDPFEDLAPGDLGYRLRGGRSGFDPFDNALEQGRFGGMVLKSMLSHPVGLGVVVVLAAMFLASVVLSGNWATLGITVVIAIGVVILWRVAKQDLEDIQRNGRDS